MDRTKEKCFAYQQESGDWKTRLPDAPPPPPPISITALGCFHHLIWVQKRRWNASHMKVNLAKVTKWGAFLYTRFHNCTPLSCYVLKPSELCMQVLKYERWHGFKRVGFTLRSNLSVRTLYKWGPALDQLKPVHDQHFTSLNQLKPATMLQNIPNQHMVFFFNRITCVTCGNCSPRMCSENGEYKYMLKLNNLCINKNICVCYVFYAYWSLLAKC